MNARQQSILQVVIDKGRMSVADLAKMTGVSEVTIRQELNCLLDDPKDSILWIGTQRAGLNAYNYVKDTFTSVSYTHLMDERTKEWMINLRKVGVEVRKFDYMKLADRLWDGEVVSYICLLYTSLSRKSK